MSDPKNTSTPQATAAAKTPAELQAEIERLTKENESLKKATPPAQDASKTLTRHPSGTKLVKVRALREFQRYEGAGIAQQGAGVKPKDEIYVDEEEAKSLCRVVQGNYSFRGERFDDIQRHSIQLAERVG